MINEIIVCLHGNVSILEDFNWVIAGHFIVQ